MADKPNFPLILGIPMFIDDTRVNPEYVKEVMKYVKYKTTSLYPAINNVTSVGYFSDGFTLGHGESPTVVGAQFDENVGKHYAQQNAIKASEAKVWQMLGALLYFKLSGTIEVKDPYDMSGDQDSRKQELLRDKWGFHDEDYEGIQLTQAKYTGRKAKLWIEEFDSKHKDARYGYNALIMNLPSLPTANQDVWTNDDFKFIFDYTPEHGVRAITMVYYMNFVHIVTGTLLRSEKMQVISGTDVITNPEGSSNGAGETCCSSVIQIPGGEDLDYNQVGAFVSEIASLIIEKRLKNDLKGRYLDTYPPGK